MSNYEEAITTTKEQLAREQGQLQALENIICQLISDAERLGHVHANESDIERALLIEKLEEALYRKEERIANREAKLYGRQLSEAASKSEDSIEDYPF